MINDEHEACHNNVVYQCAFRYGRIEFDCLKYFIGEHVPVISVVDHRMIYKPAF
jgi:hypothetical protein